jgi:hypothetical protein
MNEIIDFLSKTKQNITGFSEPFNISDFNFILLSIILIILFFNFISRRKMQKRIESIPGLELNDKIFSDIKKINDQLDIFSVHKTNAERNFQNISRAFDNVKIVKSKKYNPYADMGVGGNQSFSLALINRKGDGVILTSLYSRDRTRVLLKEINSFEPNQELTPEEREVLREIRETK